MPQASTGLTPGQKKLQREAGKGRVALQFFLPAELRDDLAAYCRAKGTTMTRIFTDRAEAVVRKHRKAQKREA